MAKAHYTVVRDAEAKGIALEYDAENDRTTATHGDGTTITHAAPKQAVAILVLARKLAAEYPALRLEQDGDEYHVVAVDPEHSEFRITLDEVYDSTLSFILEAADEAGIDPEAGYEEEDHTSSGSVVADSYKKAYAEAGHPTHCGDWLAQFWFTNKPTKSVVDGGKTTVLDVDEADRLFLQNGVDSSIGKWGATFHGNKAPKNGWEGRFAMSGLNILRKRVADAGQLLWNHEVIEPPADWVEANKSAPKKPRKSRKKDPLDAVGVVPADEPEATEEAGA